MTPRLPVLTWVGGSFAVLTLSAATGRLAVGGELPQAVRRDGLQLRLRRRGVL
jgi:hypothetical protein